MTWPAARFLVEIKLNSLLPFCTNPVKEMSPGFRLGRGVGETVDVVVGVTVGLLV